MPPTGSDAGNRNLGIEEQLWLWNRHTKLGKAFNSSTGFHLSNKADRSPDAAGVKLERWEALTLKEQQGYHFQLIRLQIDTLKVFHSKSCLIQNLKSKIGSFAPICLDLVVEL